MSRILQGHRTELNKTRRALGGAHVPPTKVFRRLTASLNHSLNGSSDSVNGDLQFLGE